MAVGEMALKVKLAGFILAGAVLTSRSLAVTTTLNALADGNINGGAVNSLYSPGIYGLVVNAFNGGTKPVIDFNLSSIPTHATITSVQFNFDETSHANANSTVSILDYGRGGAITAADATAAATQIGSYNATTVGLGLQSINLNSAADSSIQSLLGGSLDLGVRLEAGSNETNTSMGAIEQSSAYVPPALQVTYSVPEPASVGIVGVFGLYLLHRRPSALTRR
jgi:hypothetical protein